MALAGPLGAADPLAARVVVVANGDDPDSVRIAQHYAEVRGVPTENIIALSLSVEETITWTEFVTTLWQPLQDELVRRKWIDAIPMALTDAVGRRKQAFSGHRISYLVLCRGVPLRIGHDPARYQPHPPVTDNPFFQTNQAAVDSELSLLAVNDSPINAFLVNPLFRNDHPAPWELTQVVKVARLDGPTAADAAALVDRAMAAERTGLLGRAYVDLGGIRPDGDQWLRSAADQLGQLGFDTVVDTSPATFSAAARFDAPVLYLGWYAGRLNGPFALPGFRFPPGAVAVHIHSFSAETLRSSETAWCGPLVARGVTATVGNVYEPYLQLLHRPDLLLRSLARGDTFGDAAYYSEPVLSWQAVAIGDPLYRPFAVSFEEQWGRRRELPRALEPYAVLRRIRLLDAAHRTSAAETLLETAMAAQPSLPLGLELARRREVIGDLAGAGRALAAIAGPDELTADNWSATREVAAGLARTGAPTRAVAVYARLLGEPSLPLGLREPWLREATEAARAAGDEERAAAWARERELLLGGPKR